MNEVVFPPFTRGEPQERLRIVLNIYGDLLEGDSKTIAQKYFEDSIYQERHRHTDEGWFYRGMEDNDPWVLDEDRMDLQTNLHLYLTCSLMMVKQELERIAEIHSDNDIIREIRGRYLPRVSEMECRCEDIEFYEPIKEYLARVWHTERL